MTSRRQFEEICMALAAGIGKPMQRDTVRAWYVLLGDLPPAALQAAATRALCEAEYPVIPPVGRIRRFAIEFLHGVPITPEEAFQRVRAAISRFGLDRQEKAREALGLAVWRAVQGIGGWQRVCDSPVDRRDVLFAQFRDSWLRLQDREQMLARLPAAVRPRVAGDRDDPTSIAELLPAANHFQGPPF